jgi:glycosyltransferase involved in cell wall biosynthesis
VKIAVLHDRFMSFAGGENVAFEIAKTLDAPLYTAYIAHEAEGYLDQGVEIIPFQQEKYIDSWKSKFIKREGLETLFISLDFETLDLSDYDIVVSSHVLTKSYVPTPDQKVIHYCHSPPRWLFDLYRYRMGGLSPRIHFIAKIYADWWRKRDLLCNNFIDMFLTNSEVVRTRIQRYYHRDAKIVYPPVETKKFRCGENEGYFLAINRLYPEKRIDVMIEAFRKMPNMPLKIIGVGYDEEYEEMAGGCTNIEFLGAVSEEEKLELLANCTAVISIPVDEDFGIVPIEAMASGKPVIGVCEGFTKYQIAPNFNGVFIEPNDSGLIRGVDDVITQNWDTEKIKTTAAKYDVSIFRRGIEEAVKTIYL